MHKPPLLVRFRLAGIQKMRSIFFERSKSSGVAVTQPAGWGGKSNEFKGRVNAAKALRLMYLILYRFHGAAVLKLPNRLKDNPEIMFVEWHNENIYQG